jgi:serpin B
MESFTAGPEDLEGPIIPVFMADHPFVFIIQQKDSGNILFMGRITNPSK